jgi:hypothetical protein
LAFCLCHLAFGIGIRFLPAVFALLLSLPAAAAAQETREAAIAAEQAEKATRLAPRVPSGIERILTDVANSIGREPAGFYPWFSSVYSGGGFTLGAGYRQFIGDGTNWNIGGLYSRKGYKLIEASGSSPNHFSGRLDARGRIGWRDATQVAFYGLGIDSPSSDDVAFRLQQGYAGADFTFRPYGEFFLRGGATYEKFTLKDPKNDDLIPVEEVHTPETAPGLESDPTYLHTSASIGFDSRPATDYARRGGLYELTHHWYNDDRDTYSFERLDARVIQHIPILRETWVISLRGQLQATLSDDTVVPYFLMPALGSGSTLRAYSSWRFRDRHSVLASGEFRWIVNRLGFDMALFYDTGMVASRLDGIAAREFVSDFGVGARFHGPTRTPLRIELAHGREGMNLVFGGSAAF